MGLLAEVEMEGTSVEDVAASVPTVGAAVGAAVTVGGGTSVLRK